MIERKFSPQKAALLKDSKMFQQIQGQISAQSMQSYKNAKRQFLKKRGQAILKLNDLSSEQYFKSCSEVLASAKKDMIENRKKQQMDSDNVFKILDEKLKSRNQVEHPLYSIYERILDIEKELKKSNANEELTESNIQIVKNQIDTINSNLKNIKTQNKQSVPNKNETNTVKRYLQDQIVNRPNFPQTTKARATVIAQNQQQSRISSSGLDIQLTDDLINQKPGQKNHSKQQKITTLQKKEAKEAQKSKQQTKQPKKIVNNAQINIDNKKIYKQAYSNKKSSNDSGSDTMNLDDDAIFNMPSKQKKYQKQQIIEKKNTNEQLNIKSKDRNQDNKNVLKNQTIFAQKEKIESIKKVESKNLSIKPKQTSIKRQKQNSDDDMEIISEQNFHNSFKNTSQNQSLVNKLQKKQQLKEVELKKQPIKTIQGTKKPSKKKQSSDEDMEIISDSMFQNASKTIDKRIDQAPLTASKSINIENETQKIRVEKIEKNNEKANLFPIKQQEQKQGTINRKNNQQDQSTINLRESQIGGIVMNKKQGLFKIEQNNYKEKSTSIFGGITNTKKSIFDTVLDNKATIFTKTQEKKQKQVNSSINNQPNKQSSIFSKDAKNSQLSFLFSKPTSTEISSNQKSIFNHGNLFAASASLSSGASPSPSQSLFGTLGKTNNVNLFDKK